jgi:hypothetical protein
MIPSLQKFQTVVWASSRAKEFDGALEPVLAEEEERAMRREKSAPSFFAKDGDISQLTG